MEDATFPLAAIFGGTFDPVHCGHISAALQAQRLLNAERFMLVPCAQPPHRAEPLASAEHRLAMLNLAVAQFDPLQVDDIELRRPGPSYMVDTLAELRHSRQGFALVLVLGRDAAASLDHWHRWRSLFDLCHLAVLSRHGEVSEWPPAVEAELRGRQKSRAEALRQARNGFVIELDIDSPPVSASRVRQMIASGVIPGEELPGPVRDYIGKHGLYRDVRS